MSTENENRKIYFDTASTTPVRREVIDRIMDVMKNVYGNPSSLHDIGVEAKNIVSNSIYKICKKIGANSNKNEIIFTSGACEANTLAIEGLYKATKDKRFVLITTDIEHKSIMNLIKDGIEYAIVEYVPLYNREGSVKINELEKLCKKYSDEQYKVLVSIHSANNEIGTIQDIKKISEIAHKYNAIFHTDATQLFPYYKIDVEELGIDMLSMSGQKINAPKGIGFLYVKDGIELKPIIYGSQMNGVRGGTENVPYIAGLATAIDLLDYDNSNLINMQYYLFSKLSENNIDFITNGCLIRRLPNNINISIKDIDGESLLFFLNDLGIYVSSGSACNSVSTDISYVIKSVNYDENYSNGTIRITISKNTTKEDVDYFIDSLVAYINLNKHIKNK